ncbi:uncharacterized protein MONOS_13975 [Monocercomonoides exilis]|uniref:uncharacterized protein n=1 Tax=Monocercomonoides exilis TaxID=2049356 RepID=UPI00355A4AB5|nr:hypothetical protein MONOS_13975 [Monocercomonoides exilis]|eukprot:MONOS_13975.1-p1 / transcript=MONOS_13975.1 / gene=MONOS_13975 / organism=Monocercomonoides_exilis_PA203 / gene_product=unspecified product / transcript_product=unspecified product / location=Mono_scaffold00914:16506-17402(+) / protein_length=230 / sequence_SO=supercontig / SO=protein_coding / is_pseudo=false
MLEGAAEAIVEHEQVRGSTEGGESAELRWACLPAAEKREEDAVRDPSRGEEGRVCRCEGRVKRKIAEGEDAVVEKSDNSNEIVVAKKTSSRFPEIWSTAVESEAQASGEQYWQEEESVYYSTNIWWARKKVMKGRRRIEDGDWVGVGGVGAADGGVCGEEGLSEVEGKEVLVDLGVDAGALKKDILIHEGIVQCTAVVKDREMNRVFSNSVQSTNISLPLMVGRSRYIV